LTPRERAIAALTLKQPDLVPHFELEMQLAPEYFGRDFVSKAEWDANPSRAAQFLQRDAELFLQIADYFDYCIIFYSHIHRPTHADYVRGIEVLRELDHGRHLLLAHGDTTLSIPDGERLQQLSYDLFEKRDEILAGQRAAVERQLAATPELLRAGLDGFALCFDYCFNNGPFMSPAMFAEFVTPFLTDLIAGYRGLGAYVIKHTDGNIMPILDQLVAARPHALHSLDPMAGVDIREVKAPGGQTGVPDRQRQLRADADRYGRRDPGLVPLRHGKRQAPRRLHLFHQQRGVQGYAETQL
jgi:uroporphyrinogen decarboxylase